MNQRRLQIPAFGLIIAGIRDPHKFVCIKTVAFQDLFQECGGILGDSDDFAVVALVENIVFEIPLFVPSDILRVPQVQALQILEIHAGVFVEVSDVMAVFADPQLEPVFFHRVPVFVPRPVSVGRLKQFVAFEHGNIPDAVDGIHRMRAAVDVGNRFNAPFL